MKIFKNYYNRRKTSRRKILEIPCTRRKSICSHGNPLEKIGFSFLSDSKTLITSFLDIRREDTYLFDLFHNIFDPEVYSLLVNCYYELLKLPYWILEIVQRSPQLYWDYYYHGKYQQLPPRRNPCLLREGLSRRK
jgi:hypothetical protein